LDKENPMNPGPCNEITHGKMKLVENRLGEEKIVACMNEDSKYLWKSIDGTLNSVKVLNNEFSFVKPNLHSYRV
jgi:hypothetical protein